MLWLKAFHIIFMVTWFAGLFYLPRLFVYHTMADDQASNERFKIMERKLFHGIMTPGAILTIIFGLSMIWYNGWDIYANAGWMHIKLTLVAILIGYHLYCGKIVSTFKHDLNQRSHVYFRWFNEFPVLILIGVIILAVVRPI